jgi:anti-sigma regulatory factor (Ser/Thr protein kinase)
MVNNIHASGKVLLDTINHVLDFSKVNRRSKEKKRLPKRRQKKFDRRQSVDDGSEDKADVCVLSEEVLESVYAGQRISKKAFGLSGHRRQASTGEDGSPVTVIVDIQWHINWTFEIDAGAWRRILMNLFSNAMKYTEVGFVNISLDLEDDVASRSKHPRSNLTLRIKDSGKGISQEFLKHQLYKPFTQEDSLASGAGLGLSIVKAIVQDLGGKIEFNSEAGTGTEAVVRIPLTASVASKSGDLDLLVEVRKVTKGLKFRLEAFDRYPDITETPTGILSAEAEAAMLLKSTMQDSLTEWFQMEAITGTADSVVDVIVVMESGLGDRSLVDTLRSYTSDDSTKKSIAIVLSNSYHPSTHVDSCGNFRILHLQQP